MAILMPEDVLPQDDLKYFENNGIARATWITLRSSVKDLAPEFDHCRHGMTPTADTAKQGRAALYSNPPA